MSKKQTLLQKCGYITAVLGLMLTSALGSAQFVSAQQSSSTNYQVDEVFIGAGGSNDASSSSYQARASIGDLGVGNSASTNYQAYGGFTTTGAPYLEVAVTSSNLDLGTLSDTTTATGNTTFRVRAYLAHGYNVIMRSPPPTTGNGATITAMASQGGSTTGTEQFGMNAVANTSPTTFGADPVQVPDSSFSFGQAATGYDTANQFKYVNGQTFARSTKSSGQTNYTLSFIINIAPITDAGLYIFNQNLVVVATY